MSDTTTDHWSLVPQLAGRLRARLAEVEDERARLSAALAALESSSLQTKRPSRGVDATVLAAVRAEPCSRASVVALGLGADIDDVVASLGRLERRGIVRRDGMGWSPGRDSDSRSAADSSAKAS